MAIGLGSNLGDCLVTLREAAVRVANDVAPITRGSRVWESAPVGPPQPDYLNAAVLVSWPSERDLDELLTGLLAIEQGLGRVRAQGERWGPRTIDLDVLWADGGVVRRAPRLEVPHPRLAERAFAIVPLLEVAPDAGYLTPADASRALRPTAWTLADLALTDR